MPSAPLRTHVCRAALCRRRTYRGRLTLYRAQPLWGRHSAHSLCLTSAAESSSTRMPVSDPLQYPGNAFRKASADERAALEGEIASMRRTIQELQHLQLEDSGGGAPDASAVAVTLRVAADRPPDLPKPSDSRALSTAMQELEQQMQHLLLPVSGNQSDFLDQVALTKTTVGLGMTGTVIDAIVPFGPAHMTGTLQVGDTLLEIDGTPVDDLNVGALIVGDDRVGGIVRLKTRR